jgi:nicotinate-nucleotide adenylyltransferase
MKTIAIFGGTFDPVHLGHLRVAWEAADALDAQVRLMPAHVPPHRPAPIANAQQRVAMLELALAGQDRLMLDTRELRRDGPSFTVDTLRDLRTEFPKEQPIVLLLGADAFAGLPSWHEWRSLFELAHIVILTRPGHTAALSQELHAEIVSRRAQNLSDLKHSPAGMVSDLPVTSLEISSSAIRKLLLCGRDPRWLWPEALSARPDLLAIYRPTGNT